jgi:uncharacterized membrane protein
MNVAQIYFCYFGLLLASIPYFVDKFETKSEHFGRFFFVYMLAVIAPPVIYGLCI